MANKVAQEMATQKQLKYINCLIDEIKNKEIKYDEKWIKEKMSKDSFNKKQATSIIEYCKRKIDNFENPGKNEKPKKEVLSQKNGLKDMSNIYVADKKIEDRNFGVNSRSILFEAELHPNDKERLIKAGLFSSNDLKEHKKYKLHANCSKGLNNPSGKGNIYNVRNVFIRNEIIGKECEIDFSNEYLKVGVNLEWIKSFWITGEDENIVTTLEPISADTGTNKFKTNYLMFIDTLKNMEKNYHLHLTEAKEVARKSLLGKVVKNANNFILKITRLGKDVLAKIKKEFQEMVKANTNDALTVKKEVLVDPWWDTKNKTGYKVNMDETGVFDPTGWENF